MMRLTIYHAACWILGLVAFVQVVLVGTALAVRGNVSPEPEVVERVVTQYVTLPPSAEAPTPSSARPFSQPFPSVVSPEVRPAAPVERSRPAIQDPVVERLVNEARTARISGDLVVAITKLEEAQKTAAEEPNVLYELGEVAELVGNYDKAADYYEQVFQLGVDQAGVLYKEAAQKLSEGFGVDERQEVPISLGRVREFHDRRVVDGEKVILTIPILAAAGQITDPDSIVPKVMLYDQVGEELVLASDTNAPQSQWMSEPVDYLTGEEELRVTYFIPAVGLKDQHLFGTRKYVGHVVELYHQGELVDQIAWPRTLATKVNAPERDPLFLPEEYLPEDFNPDNPLLPPLPR